MNNRFKKTLLLIITVFLIGYSLFNYQKQIKNNSKAKVSSVQNKITPIPDPDVHLSLESLIKRNYKISNIKIEETLEPGINYSRYIASYQSDGLKIYGLFTVPNSPKPKNGFPSVVFLHGYLDPKTYKTTERYVLYQDGFAKNGFITFKPDLRGHGKSEGKPVNSNFSEDYVIDTLNLIAALKTYKDGDPKLIGLWGHSNGGGITLRAMEISKDIKAAVIWAGVVGSYEDLLDTYKSKIPWINSRREVWTSQEITPNSPQDFIKKYGPPNLKSPFWSKIDPYAYIQNISAPVELHHGTSDESVPIELSYHFRDVLKKAGKTVKFYEYQGGDHNLSEPAFTVAMQRSVTFFKNYLSR